MLKRFSLVADKTWTSLIRWLAWPAVRSVLAALLLAASLPGPTHAQEREPADDPYERLLEAWSDSTLLQVTRAHRRFNEILDDYADDPDIARQARLGIATTYLSLQPKTQGNIDRAAEIYREILAEDTSDEIGRMARYFLGRIYEFHSRFTDPDEAIRHYRMLYEEHPDTMVAQLAILKVANLEVLGEPPGPSIEAELTQWREVALNIDSHSVRRNLYRLLGDAYVLYELRPDDALEMYRRAEELGFIRFDFRFLLLRRVIGWSEELGKTEQTIAALRRYLEEHQNNEWYYYFQKRLEELEAQQAESENAPQGQEASL